MHGILGNRRVISCLTAQPPAVAQAKVAVKPKIGISRDSTLARDNVAYALRRHANVLGKPVFGQAKRLEEFFVQHFAWGNGGHRAYLTLLLTSA